MLRRPGLAFILIISALSPTPVVASTHGLDFRSNQRSRMPSVSQVIERFLRAVGGRAAWLKIKTQYVAGTMEVQPAGIKGTYEAYAKSPIRSLVVFKLPSVEFRAGVDGQRSWSQKQQAEAQYDPPAEQAAKKRDSDSYKYLHFKEHFPNAQVVGIEEVEGAKAYVVEAIPAGEKLPERLYFNISTGILVRRDTSSEDSEGQKTTGIQYYNDYREIDGLKIAFSQRIIHGYMTIVIKVTEVKNNIAMSDTIFNLPANK
jgi:hypothetical protein